MSRVFIHEAGSGHLLEHPSKLMRAIGCEPVMGEVQGHEGLFHAEAVRFLDGAVELRLSERAGMKRWIPESWFIPTNPSLRMKDHG